MQIRTNQMDNDAETKSRQKHSNYKIEQNKNIDKELRKKGKKVYQKAYLFRSLLLPQHINSYNGYK